MSKVIFDTTNMPFRYHVQRRRTYGHSDCQDVQWYQTLEWAMEAIREEK